MAILLSLLFTPIGLIGTALWIWMLYDCLKQGYADRHTWLWVLIFLNVLGAILYFFICWWPRNSRNLPVPQFARRWRSQDAIWQAEAEVKNIGKAHQYAKLGGLLFDVGKLDQALSAYEEALNREPNHIEALWGAAQSEICRGNWETAKSHLELLIKLKPDHAYGDGSLAYGQVLYEMGDLDAAIAYLQQHLRSWSHPQGYLTLADAYRKQSKFSEARESLETMIIKIKSAPTFQYRKSKPYVREGEKRLRELAKLR
jgi:tetratricopeptide (TPR) repeat protein